MTKFFDGHSYFIDEKVNFFKFENTYQVFNESGQNIGSINQRLTAGQKALRLLLNKKMLPFKLEIKDSAGMMVASITRGWTFWLSKTQIFSSDGHVVGTVEQKFKLFKPTFKIINHQGMPVAEITGDWTAWNFVIINDTGMQVGTISKKWGGAMKEIFTTADKYFVALDPSYSNMMNKIIVLSAAITIDMVLKESK
ncbi:MAG TPA: phospholipid scramblase-related protein [Cyclobacteriaceae bacterium]|nr:phospholipid scramblase-related protein [Cyclobacteriaceae bacterium]